MGTASLRAVCLADIIHSATCLSMRKVFLGKQMFAFPPPPDAYATPSPRNVGEGFGGAILQGIRNILNANACNFGCPPERGKVARSAERGRKQRLAKKRFTHTLSQNWKTGACICNQGAL